MNSTRIFEKGIHSLIGIIIICLHRSGLLAKYFRKLLADLQPLDGVLSLQASYAHNVHDGILVGFVQRSHVDTMLASSWIENQEPML